MTTYKVKRLGYKLVCTVILIYIILHICIISYLSFYFPIFLQLIYIIWKSKNNKLF